jgi:photosystem II stability/assembly factor-like uncharacterized protein
MSWSQPAIMGFCILLDWCSLVYCQAPPSGTSSGTGHRPVTTRTPKPTRLSSSLSKNTRGFTETRGSVQRTADQVEFARRYGTPNWEYRDAYLYWLRQRAFPFDKIEPSTHRLGVQHKFGMSHEFSLTSSANKWEFVGPRKLPPPYRRYFGQGFTSGRVNGVAFDRLNPSIVYLATAGGGLWKVDRQSKIWSSLSDDWVDSKTSSIAIASSNGKETIYVGTGDFDGGRNIYGFGLMKSTDAGTTWTNVLNQELSGFSVKHIAVYPGPDHPDTLLITAGNSSSDVGAIWRSTDAGVTWNKAQLDGSDWQDVKCGSKSADGIWHCYAVGTGIGGEIWRSDDAGVSWVRLSPPISWNYQDSFAITTSPRDSQIVYLLAGTDRTIWKSTDAGDTWTDITGDFPRGDNGYNWSQSDYDYYVACVSHPTTNEDVVYVGLIDIAASIGGGTHWTSVGNTYDAGALTHNDQHSLAANPTNSKELLIGNDGGAYLLSFDEGTTTWNFDSSLNNGIGITQLYKADFSPSDPAVMLGGAQDNATPFADGDLSQWLNVGMGDGGYVVINQNAPDVQYATAQYLTIFETHSRWHDWDPSHPEKSEITFYDTVGGNQRAWYGDYVGFVAPITPDPKNPTILYAATNFLWRWDDEHAKWTDHLGGQMLTSGADDAVTVIAVSPSDTQRIYTGSQTGQVWMTTDGGNKWKRINDGLPQFWITSIAVHPSDPDTIFVGLSGTGDSLTGHPGHIWKCQHTSDDNRTWLNISGRFRPAIPNVPINSVVVDPANPARLYVGTDIGFFLTDDGGVNWVDGTRSLGLPSVQVNDLKLVAGTGYLMAATFGRGIWRLKLPVPTAANLPHLGATHKKRRSP